MALRRLRHGTPACIPSGCLCLCSCPASCCGIAFCIYLGTLYVRYDCHFLDHLFGASYAIYLFSWFPQVASQQVLLSITHWPWQVGGVLAMITGVYIPFLLYKLIVRYKPTRIGRVVALLTGQ